MIGSRVEETNVERLFLIVGILGKENSIGVRLSRIVVLTIASQTSEEYSLIFIVPFIYRQENKALSDTPSVGQGSDERRVNHIPQLTVVLSFLVYYAIQNTTGLTHGERTKFGEYIRLFYALFVTYIFYLSEYLFSHIVIIVLKAERVLYRETTPNVQRIQVGANLLQFAIYVYTLLQLVPIVSRVFYAGIDEKVQHFELELWI